LDRAAAEMENMMLPRQVTDDRDIWRRFRRQLAAVIFFFMALCLFALVGSIRDQIANGDSLSLIEVVIDALNALVLIAVIVLTAALLANNGKPSLAGRLAKYSAVLAIVEVTITSLRTLL
jgi:hypothetical protein